MNRATHLPAASHLRPYVALRWTYGHSSSKSDLAIGTVTATGDNFGTRTGAGVIFYF